MKVSSAHIKNFRLLENAAIVLDYETTIEAHGHIPPAEYKAEYYNQ